MTDSLQRFGFVPLRYQEPRIVGQAINGTGTAEGTVLAEKNLEAVWWPYIVARVAGIVAMAVGVLGAIWILPWTELLASDVLRNVGLAELLLRVTPGLVLLVLGAVLGTTLLRQHAFESELVRVSLKGEVYGSALAAGTRMPSEIANSKRLSIISEVRLSVYGSVVRSKNVGRWRQFERILDPREPPDWPGESRKRRVRSTKHQRIRERMNQDFQFILDDLSTNILPKVIIQKTWEQARQEVVVPVVGGQSVREVLVRCSYCNALNPQGTSRCEACGATLN